MKSFAKILKYAGGYKLYAFINIFCNILSVVFELLSVMLFIPFLNILFNQESVPITTKPHFSFTKDYIEAYYNYSLGQMVAENDKVAALLFVCVLVGILFFLKNVFRYLALYYISVLRTGVVRDLRKKIHQKTLVLPLSYYSEQRKGDIMSRMTADVQEVEWSILNSLELMFREPIAVILSVVVLVVMNAQLTLFAMILLPVSGLIIGQLGKSLKRSSTKVQDMMGMILSNIEETLGGLRIIKAFNAEEQVGKKFDEINDAHTQLTLKMARKRDSASPLSEFLGTTVMVTLAYYGGSLVLAGDSDFSGGEFFGYIVVFARLLTPVKSFSTAYAIVLKGAASADRIEEVLSAKNNIIDSLNPKEIKEFANEIIYKDVQFSYENTPVLDHINITIKKGKTIALVGESGGGKSTFADLLPRFYDLEKGEILIDGINIKELTIKNLRSLMGIVTQESILFNDTIFNNIALGTEKATKEQVIEAAKIANAHHFIMDMENGYETSIGDRGSKLSGGQRQRLSIARAVLKNPPILILDEATSALDTESEKLVQDALLKLMENRTSIVIAHRLSTIQHADEILVIQKGKIVERGTHNELLKLSGVYKKLSDLQSFSK
ncbi:MAG: antibiotic ABC transporter ATP-binding protein [Flavobacteriales bacterium CG_4_10_14_0_2_um_filter_32_8]|nr:MAG: antibiotic ABC transporter ATP-binding protein [Flavobacteriales bacterium CG_4_10_14_0_2_um_filter_32_8]PJB14472.1 MAG: antibiotic ABC transporter ATP-binding protein [Flavobacteriales bacterium CG_4_9_14_3_um_filter_32_8]